jgi:8-oxo-dGTP pyrophosphatase MutT (NUDIX family)
MPADTARRETFEETGLDLGQTGTPLGLLDDIYPRSVLLPKVVVTPCVFSVEGRLPVAPGDEVDQVIWLPVREIFDPASRKPYLLRLPGGDREFDSIHAGGLVVWGLTERILQQVAILSGLDGK